MSDGIRSGVNWMRRACRPSTVPMRIDQLGLGEARDADQQRMAAGQHRDQRVIDHLLLTEDDVADRGPRGFHAFGGRFRGADDHLVEIFGVCGAQRLLHSRSRAGTARPSDSLASACAFQEHVHCNFHAHERLRLGRYQGGPKRFFRRLG
jgi:hypothetical protein